MEYTCYMKFETRYRNEQHRDNVERMVGSIVEGDSLVDELKPDRPLTKYEKPNFLVATQLFGIPVRDVQVEDLCTSENLLKYVAKRHVHTISKTLDEEAYSHYMKEGYTPDPLYPDALLDEANFTIQHELPHYLIAWLLNSERRVNGNSTTPTYIEEYRDRKTILESDGVRRDFLEECYAQIIDFDESTSHSLANEVEELKRKNMPFDDALTELLRTWFVIEGDSLIEYESEVVDEEKIKKDIERCKERFLEVVTSTPEKREELKYVYPLECFVYDLCYAHYFSDKNDTRKPYKVYQKYFARLFEKANANPEMYKRKVLRR